MTDSESSALTRSTEISLEESLARWDISARVLVRSTSESRPSSEERRRMDRFLVGESVVGEVEADSSDGTWGARRDSAGCCSPKYEDSFLDIALCVAGRYPLSIP